MIYTLDGELHLQDVPTPLLHKLIRELTVPNPKYTNALRLGRPTYNIPETVMLYEIRGNALTLPRGMAEEVWREKPAGTTARDKTLKGEPLTFDTSRFTLRGYQQKAVNAALSCQWHQGVLIAPCGAGKTEIGMAVIAHLGRPALWITHTLDLAQQAKERAQLRLGLDEREVSIISGAHKRCGTKLTIATVQSLYRMELDELARTVGVVIVDECHHVVNNPEQASMFAAVLKCLPARWRFGLTASDTRSDGLSETIFQVLGPRVAVIEPQQLEQITITPRVETVPTRFVYTPRANESPIDYVRLMRCMATDADRMQTVEGVIDRAVTEGSSWLVLAASLAILERLHAYALSLGLAAEFVCGATKKAERTAALARMKAGQARILFATYQLAKEGLDIPCLDRLVLATPTRNKVIVQQSIGRIQRPAPGKTEALVIDLVDEDPAASGAAQAAPDAVQENEHHRKGVITMSELNYASALAALDGEFESASAQTGGSGVPAGRYNAILKEAKIVARTGGGIALSVSFIVTEGPYKGRYAFTSYGLSKNGLPFFKGFLQMIQLPLTKLSELEKALPLFPGHMCVIDVRPDRKNPQYTMTYVDRYLGMGNVADYLKPPAQPAAQDDLIPVDEPDDFPFN